MAPDKLQDVIHKRPFEPLRVYVSDGRTLDVRHPDQVVVSRRASYIGLDRTPKGHFQDVAMIDNLHITRVEPL